MKTNNHPLVSVVMPVYNAEKYLHEAIRSIIEQTYENWEFIIVDDKSNDSSARIIDDYQQLYPDKIRAIHLRKNLNVGGDAATNIGIKEAKGMYIAKLDADDIAHPERLQKQVSYLEEHQEIFLVGTNAYVINDTGEVIGEKTEPLSPKEIYQEYANFHPIIHPSVMFRNNIIDRENFYTIRYPIANDYYTFFSLVCQGYKFANLPDKLLYYRITGYNTSLKNVKKGLLNAMKIKLEMIQKYHYPIAPSLVLRNILQFGTGMLLPQKVSFYLYLISKGIVKKEDILRKLTSIPQPKMSFRAVARNPLHKP